MNERIKELADKAAEGISGDLNIPDEFCVLKMSDEKKRKKAEDKERERIALMLKREEQAQMLQVLRATDRENRAAKK